MFIPTYTFIRNSRVCILGHNRTAGVHETALYEWGCFELEISLNIQIPMFPYISTYFQTDRANIWPVCLPEKAIMDKNHLQFRGIKVLGYGPTNDKDLFLTSIDLEVIPIDICNERYTVVESDQDFYEIENSLPTKFENGSVFCASNYGTPDGTCQGVIF